MNSIMEKNNSQSQSEAGTVDSQVSIYTMPEKFLPSVKVKNKKSGKGIIIVLYSLIALAIIGGGATIWYFFVYQNTDNSAEMNIELDIPVIDEQKQQTNEEQVKSTESEQQGVELKFIAKDINSDEEVSSILIKLAASDADKTEKIEISTLMPDQVSGRAAGAIGAIYTIKSKEYFTFTEPTEFIFYYQEPDDLTSRKENSLRVANEVDDGSWQFIKGAELDIVTNSITVVFSSLPEGRIAILSNLEEEIITEPEEIDPVDDDEANTIDIIPLSPSKDTDKDGLTDEEEILFQTSRNMPDTDSDGYLDGDEVLNFYSPISENKLIDDELVSEYMDEEYNFSVLYPASWLNFVSDSDGEQRVVFESLQDDFIQISIVENKNKESALDWYLNLVPEITKDDLIIEKVGEFAGVISLDNANFYLSTGDKIFIFTYSAGLKTEVDYLNVWKMVYKSFSLTNNESES